MRKQLKKITAVLLAVIMLLSCGAICASAVDGVYYEPDSGDSIGENSQDPAIVEFYDDDNNELIGSCEMEEITDYDGTYYYRGYCENLDVSKGCNEVVKDAFGGNIFGKQIPSSATESYTVVAGKISVGIKPATANVTVTLIPSSDGEYSKETEMEVIDCCFSDNYNSYAVNYTYDGTAKTPEIDFYYDDEIFRLVEGEDYTAEYTDNVNAGTATVTITGIGDYKGTVTRQFTINKADQGLVADMKNKTLESGATEQIVAIGEGEITYSSSNTNVARVSDTGIVTAVGGGYTVITVSAAGNDNYNPDTTKLIVFVEGEEIITVPGDVNGDGEYDIRDAAAIQLYKAQLYKGEFDESVADMNGDGEVNIKDAAYIQLDLAKLL